MEEIWYNISIIVFTVFRYVPYFIFLGGTFMKAGLYCRVSTDAQVEGYSIDAQKKMLEAYCISKEISDYEFYIDGGYSGSNLSRPEMQRLLDDIDDKKIDYVIVYKLDRISRSQKDTLYLIEEKFNPNNIGFISIKENFDTTTPFGKAMIGILSVFAQLERETIYERTRMGMLERVKSGLWMGGGNRPIGYEYDRNTGTLVQKPKQAEMVYWVGKLYLENYSVENICDILGMSGDRIVRKILDSPVYVGMIPYKGGLYQGKHKPIFPQEMWNEIQTMRENRSKNNFKKSKYLLSGLVYCGYCGAKYRYQKWGSVVKMYCYSQQKSRPRLIRDPNCPNLKANSEDVEKYVLNELFKMSLDEKYFEKRMTTNATNDMQIAEERQKEIEKQIQNLLGVLAEGFITKEIKEKIKSLENEKKKLEKQIQKKKKQESNLKVFKEKIYNLHEIWDSLDFNEKRSILITIINKIVIKDDEIMIYYNNII